MEQVLTLINVDYFQMNPQEKTSVQFKHFLFIENVAANVRHFVQAGLNQVKK